MSYDTTYSKTQQISQAIKKLVPGATYNIRKEKVEWTDKVKTEPTQSEIDNQIAANKAEWESKEYQRVRALQYPSLQEQLDLQYWDQVNGTTKWKEAIAQVKSDNPKP